MGKGQESAVAKEGAPPWSLESAASGEWPPANGGLWIRAKDPPNGSSLDLELLELGLSEVHALRTLAKPAKGLPIARCADEAEPCKATS